MALVEGKILDHYELRRVAGEGGMADVYEALDLQTNQKVAVKVFKREDENMLRRFVREARVMASLRHEHLVPIIDSGHCQIQGDERYYIVMPFFDGGTLRAHIMRSPLSLQAACQILQSIAGALDYIHSQGIIHRDIKASNILLNANGEVFLTDFGIARISTDATQLTSTGDVLGTVDYVAPELFEEHRRADAHSDLYSLGVLLYEMVTGRLPFTAESQLVVVSMHMNTRPPSPRSIIPTLSSQVERVLNKALEKRPEQRYASATDLAGAFCNAVYAGKKGKGQNSDQNSRIERFEVPAPTAVIAESSQASASPVATIDTVPGQSPPVNVVSSHQFKSPQSVIKGAPVQTKLPPSQLPPSSNQEEVRQPARKRWFAIVLACLALIILIASVIAALLLPPRIKSGVIAPNTATHNATGIGTVVHSTTIAATPNLTATAIAAQAATATARAREGNSHCYRGIDRYGPGKGQCYRGCRSHCHLWNTGLS